MTYHFAALDVVEALEQRHGGALATARRAHQRDRLTRLHVEVQAPQHLHLGARRVVELHAPEADDAHEVALPNTCDVKCMGVSPKMEGDGWARDIASTLGMTLRAFRRTHGFLAVRGRRVDGGFAVEQVEDSCSRRLRFTGVRREVRHLTKRHRAEHDATKHPKQQCSTAILGARRITPAPPHTTVQHGHRCTPIPYTAV